MRPEQITPGWASAYLPTLPTSLPAGARDPECLSWLFLGWLLSPHETVPSKLLVPSPELCGLAGVP